MRSFTNAALLIGVAAIAACHKTAPPGSQERANVGFVLHVPNDFTQIIRKGAERAAADMGAQIEVAGPASYAPTDAIALFEGMVQKRKAGLVVVPQPADLWVVPIRQATEAGIPVLIANVTSPDSTGAAWFGQDELRSGTLLAAEIRKALAAGGKTEGKVVVGICGPGMKVLTDRLAGFKSGMEGGRFVVTGPFDVTMEATSNYGAWENLAAAHTDMVAAIGLCSHDIPNMAKLKKRSGARWLIGGYDLHRETLQAIKEGVVQVTLGQHPFLQGYLPVRALVEQLRGGKPTRGWIDVGTEVVTRKEVDEILRRENSAADETAWYGEYMGRTFKDLPALARPMPGRGTRL